MLHATRSERFTCRRSQAARFAADHSSIGHSLLGLLCAAIVFLPSQASEPDRAPGAEKVIESPISDSDREHWSFRPLVRPSVPIARDLEVTNPIDCFVGEKLSAKKLGFAPQADQRTLLRRLALDLTGLLPEEDGTQALVGEPSTVLEREIDRLMASPSFGERTGLGWLDLARYAETDGFEHDKVRSQAWRYRDWVIEALNSGMPYDRFIALQLAGDLLSQQMSEDELLRWGGVSREQAKTATMFCLSGPDMPDLNDQVERRHTLLNEITSTVGSALMGLQMQCAACHDHKYDPLSQGDFYRLRAILETGVPELARDSLVGAMAETKFESPARFYRRGDHRQPGAAVEPAIPRIADPAGKSRAIVASQHPRLELVNALIDSSNPLTARVIANRLWQHHFGRGLAPTSSDLGLAGVEPTHGELLDWLACELRDSGWDMKRLHRLILGSRTYRQSSWESSMGEDAADTEWKKALEVDPDNSLYSRFPRRRMEGETIRDAMLQVAGMLNADRGGPSISPPLPQEILQTLLPGQWKESSEVSSHYRRSIYVFARRNLRYPMFECFDRPDAIVSCPTRNRSTTATQSLMMFNSEFSAEVAGRIASRILEQHDSRSSESRSRGVKGEDADALIRLVFRREATEPERGILREFLIRSDEDRGQRLKLAALALINSNEFLTLE